MQYHQVIIIRRAQKAFDIRPNTASFSRKAKQGAPSLKASLFRQLYHMLRLEVDLTACRP